MYALEFDDMIGINLIFSKFSTDRAYVDRWREGVFLVSLFLNTQFENIEIVTVWLVLS